MPNMAVGRAVVGWRVRISVLALDGLAAEQLPRVVAGRHHGVRLAWLIVGVGDLDDVQRIVQGARRALPFLAAQGEDRADRHVGDGSGVGVMDVEPGDGHRVHELGGLGDAVQGGDEGMLECGQAGEQRLGLG